MLRTLCAMVVAGATIVVPGPPAGWAALGLTQQRLNAAATAIQRAAAALPGSGYTNVVAAPETGRLDVYWKGPVPDDVERVVSAQTVPVRILPARFSAAELVPEARRLGMEPGVAETAPLVDGSGIRVRLARGVASVNAVSSSPFPTVLAGETGDAAWSRENDSAAYSGGGRTGNCTAGFAVDWNGGTRLLYAGHCGDNGRSVRDGGGQLMGRIINDNDGRDTAMIDARSSGRMWDGGVRSGFSKPVRGATFSNPGNWLCTSGSRSGVICGMRVRLNNVTRGNRFPMVEAEHLNHGQAGGPGDSGGPVFELPFPDDGSVIAKGIVHGGDDNAIVPCTIGETDRTGCAWRFYYADVTQTLEFYGATILVDQPQ